MTQKDKQLLLQDLCARLPYRVKIGLIGANKKLIGKPFVLDVENYKNSNPLIIINSNWLPYLRPMSSMTEEEKKEINGFLGYRKEINVFGDIHCMGWNGDVFVDIDKVYGYLNWLNAHHFDYRGLIELGLALEAPEGMYNLNKK